MATKRDSSSPERKNGAKATQGEEATNNNDSSIKLNKTLR